MKRLKLLTLFSVFAFSLLLISCSSDNDLTVKKETDNQLINSNIGNYHNIALDLYLNRTTATVTTDYKEIRKEIIDLLSKHEDSKIFNYHTLVSESAMSNEILEKISILKPRLSNSRVNAESISNAFPDLIKYLIDNKKISEALGTELLVVSNHVIQKDLSSNEILLMVNALQVHDGSLKESDSKYLNSFKQVYNSSHEYWNGKTNSSGRIQANGDGVILADAIGGLYGMLLGPVFSIIEGALFSIIANNQ